MLPISQDSFEDTKTCQSKKRLNLQDLYIKSCFRSGCHLKDRDAVAFGIKDGSAEGQWGKTDSSKIGPVKGRQRSFRRKQVDALNKGLRT